MEEKRRLRDDSMAFSSFLRRRSEEGCGSLLPEPSDGTLGKGSKLHMGRFRLDTGGISLLGGWSDTGTIFLGRWSMPQVYLLVISIFHYFLTCAEKGFFLSCLYVLFLLQSSGPSKSLALHRPSVCPYPRQLCEILMNLCH